MKIKILKLLDAISEIWGKLPAEAKVTFYYAGASGVNLIADVILSTQTIDWNTLIRVWIANILFVFLKQLNNRISTLKK